MEEIWKPVVGFEGAYEVSNLGNVRSIDRIRNAAYGASAKIRGRMMAIRKNTNNDYLLVRLVKDGRTHHCLIHRLVAMAFLPNPLNLPEVNHRDEDKQNNTCTNLEWCSRKYNINYGTARERTTKKRSFEVIQYSLIGGEIKRYTSAREAARAIGKSQAPISKCCVGSHGYRTAYGYVWRYAKDI